MSSKHSLAAAHNDSDSGPAVPLWFRASSLPLLAVAIILLIVVLGDRVYQSRLSLAALVAVLLALAATAFLHAHAWYEARKDVYATEREFTSVFQHVLDAILILDDNGVCLDANPAAFALLGVAPGELVGHSFVKFCEDHQKFERQRNAFLGHSQQRGQTELLRADGTKLVAHYTLAANYLPGRHVMVLCNITERVEAQDSLRESKEHLQQISDNIHEVVWMMDASTKRILGVNRAYEIVSGRSLESLAGDPFSYEDLIHPGDREHILAKLEEAVHSGHFDEEFRIVRPDGETRWVGVKANPMPHGRGPIRKLVGTAQDITARKLAAAQVAQHLVAAEAARAEAEALRNATLALTQDLRMDAVLDTLLRCLREIVPYDSACVILAETDERLLVARESPAAPANRPVVTLEMRESFILQRVLLLKKNVHLADTREEEEWRKLKPLANIRSWIGVPLVVSDSVLGMLSIGSTQPHTFTAEHLRRAKSLVIPAAVAIQNARIYEWAQIYATERQHLLKRADAANTTEIDGAPLPRI